ncbi:MAG: septum formation protein Maf [Candidatus Aenigmatarchaeota archaeon]|nr:MAG: septum formation protein Maf [Candidatus Aenigmarchaeota archaeon]
MKIILASRSPRRRRLLRDMGINFKVVPSDADESKVDSDVPRDMVRKLAMLKAATVANGMREHALVIGADTVVVIDNEIIGKPGGKRSAKETLSRLSGREHYVYTGICVINTKTGNVYTDVQKTKVQFRELSGREINRCLEMDHTLDGAGSYMIQDQPFLIKSIEGSFSNVVGLPMEKLVPILRENGADI